MIVLITGGTGFVGLNLAQQLCKNGFKPVLMALAPMTIAMQQQLLQEGISFDFFAWLWSQAMAGFRRV